jgi:competence protein ComEA
MFKTCATALLSFALLSMAWAQVDLNQASEIELDGLHGVGPALTRDLLRERQKAAFQNWTDVMRRVKGMGPTKAANLSAHGVRVQGLPFEPSEAQVSSKTP